MTRGKRVRLAFTFIELLVSIGIIAVLMGLTLPAIQKVRTAFRRVESANNLKQMALATHDLHNVIGFLPPACAWNNKDNKSVEGGANGTIFFMLLPFLDQQNLYQQFYGRLPAPCNPTDRHYAPEEYAGVAAYRANLPVANVRTPKQFQTILDVSGGSGTSYLANYPLLKLRTELNQIPDGSANTVLFAEGNAVCQGGAAFMGSADYGSQYNYTSGDWSFKNFYAPSALTPVFNYKLFGWNTFPDGFFISNQRTNNWLVGSEMVDYSPQSSSPIPHPHPNNSLSVKTAAYPVDINQSDFTVNPYKITAPKRELQATVASVRSYYDCNDLGEPHQQLDDQPRVMGNIPVFYNVPGYGIQDPSYYKSREVQTLSFDDSGSGSGTFQFGYADYIVSSASSIVYSGWKLTNQISYSSNASVLISNLQAAFDAAEGPGVVTIRGTDLHNIRLEFPKVSAAEVQEGISLVLIQSGLKNVQASIYESQYALGSMSRFSTTNCIWFSPQIFSGALRVAMADGSVHSIAPTISPTTWNAAVTPNGGEVLDAEFFE